MVLSFCMVPFIIFFLSRTPNKVLNHRLTEEKNVFSASSIQQSTEGHLFPPPPLIALLISFPRTLSFLFPAPHVSSSSPFHLCAVGFFVRVKLKPGGAGS